MSLQRLALLITDHSHSEYQTGERPHVGGQDSSEHWGDNHVRITSRLISALTIVSATVLIVALLTTSAAPAAATSKRAPVFDVPNAMAANKNDVWVTNLGSNSVSEFSAKTGALVRVVDAKADDFHRPDGVAVSGADVWVTNSNEEEGMGTMNYPLAKYSSVTELNASNGSLVRVINAKADDLLDPGPIVISHSHVWVENSNSAQSATSTPMNAIIELNESNGSLVGVFKTNIDGLNGPLAMGANSSDVWVANADGDQGSITELNASTGSVVRVISAKDNDLAAPESVAPSGARVWIANVREGDTSITELNASNGSLVRVINAKADGLSGLIDVAAKGPHVWAANAEGCSALHRSCSVTELNTSDGSLVRVINTKADDFHGADNVVVSGSHVWILDVFSQTITELNASNGSLVRVIK